MKRHVSMSHLRPVAGFDVGQTSTSCVLVDETGCVLGRGHGPGVIHLHAESGATRFGEAVAAALQTALAEQTNRTPTTVVLGATGVMDRDSTEARLAAHLVQTSVPDADILVVSDAETAVFGAHGGDAGVIVIAGTGSIALGRDAQGRQARAGGWGWLVDDAGSAFAIGRDGLQAAVRGAEGSGPVTDLTQRLRAHFQIHDLYDVKRTVYATDFGARGFAALSVHVSSAAEAGDGVAQAIIGRAAADLANLACAVSRQLAPNHEETLPVACLGGAFVHVMGLYDTFVAALTAEGSRLRPRAPLLPPDCGAALMALQSQGIDAATVLPNLVKSAATRA